jgi:hypothetical protein
MLIKISIKEGESLDDAQSYIPRECEDTFKQVSATDWQGEFVVSCPTFPDASPGDFEEDLAPHLYDFLLLKKFYDASYELQIAVGAPGPDFFDLQPHSVALLAALGASITVVKQ